MKLRLPSVIAIEASALTILCLIAGAAALVGCREAESAPEHDTESSSATHGALVNAELPAFRLNEVDARDLLEAAGPPWAASELQDAQLDSFSGGYSRYLLGSTGSAAIYTRADGQVWRVKMMVGGSGGCGDPATTTRAIETLRQLPGGRLTTSGDCVRTVMVTAS